jgi:hypothetical protein
MQDRSVVTITVAGRAMRYRLVEWESGSALVIAEDRKRRVIRNAGVIGYDAAGKIVRRAERK